MFVRLEEVDGRSFIANDVFACQWHESTVLDFFKKIFYLETLQRKNVRIRGLHGTSLFWLSNNALVGQGQERLRSKVVKGDQKWYEASKQGHRSSMLG